MDYTITLSTLVVASAVNYTLLCRPCCPCCPCVTLVPASAVNSTLLCCPYCYCHALCLKLHGSDVYGRQAFYMYPVYGLIHMASCCQLHDASSPWSHRAVLSALFFIKHEPTLLPVDMQPMHKPWIRVKDHCLDLTCSLASCILKRQVLCRATCMSKHLGCVLHGLWVSKQSLTYGSVSHLKA